MDSMQGRAEPQALRSLRLVFSWALWLQPASVNTCGMRTAVRLWQSGPLDVASTPVAGGHDMVLSRTLAILAGLGSPAALSVPAT